MHEAPALHAEHVPLSQTRPVPHVVPFVTLLPVSLQTAVPVVQTMLPVWHWFGGVQLVPDEHVVHDPLSQTSPVPHDVPLLTGVPVSVHTATPVEQSVVPVSHGLAGVHAAFWVQAAHVPLSHTSLVPQVVPLAALVPVSVHTAVPVEQSVVPAWHGLAGVQVAPCVHALHAPLLHTSLVPHDVPLAALVPVSVHTGTPVVHEVNPTWHGLVGVQVDPPAHALHAPLSQTSLVPHTVPFGACVPVSVHVGVLPEQSRVPVSHALAGVHGDESAHALQTPFSHTSLVPHDAPFGRLLFVFVQTDAPLAQLVAQTVHELAGVHPVPAVHGLQTPPRHTMFAPHDVPLDTCVPVSLHTATPVEQSVEPVSQTLAGVHGALCVQAVQFPSSHTRLVPHEVPFEALVPVPEHTATPVEQSVAPISHGLVGVHAVP